MIIRGIALVIILLIVDNSCSSPSEPDRDIPYEQIAVHYFSDSLLHNPDAFLKDDYEFFLLPDHFDSLWLEQGFFSNCSILSDSIIRKTSKPYFNSDALIDDDYMDRKLFKRSNEYLKDAFQREESNPPEISIKLPNNIGFKRDQDVDSEACLWLLEPKHYIKADDEITVELSFSQDQEMINLLIFMKYNGDILGWNYRVYDK
ncbi:MAG: hypothetical protein ABJH04_01815 [Cyclobacteriaceae bacterium]